MALGLLEGAHDAKGAEQIAIGVSCDAWNDGVVRPLARAQAVGVLGIQQEVVPPVVQREAAALWDNACTSSGSHISRAGKGLLAISIPSRKVYLQEPQLQACPLLCHMGLQPASMLQAQRHSLSQRH